MMQIMDILALFFTSLAITGLTMIYWILALRSDGVMTKLRQFFGLLLLSSVIVWATETVYMAGLAGQFDTYVARKMVFRLMFGVAIFWLLWGLLHRTPPVPAAQIDIDTEHRITRWNEAATHLLGYTEAEAKGQLVYELIIPENLRQAHIDGMEHYRKTHETRILNVAFTTDAQRKDKKIIPVQLLVTRHIGLQGTRFMAIILPAPLP